MPEISDAVTDSGPEMSSLLENLQKHKLNTTTRQNVVNSSTSSIKETSSSSTSSSQQASFVFKRKRNNLFSSTYIFICIYTNRGSHAKCGNSQKQTAVHRAVIFALCFWNSTRRSSMLSKRYTKFHFCFFFFCTNEKPLYFVPRQLEIDANLSQYFMFTDVYVECNFCICV